MNRAEALGCVLVNLAMCPGWGTIVSGRRISGLAQLMLAVLGVLLVMAGFCWFFSAMFHDPDFVHPPWNGREGGLVLQGFATFSIAWIWAAFSSFSIVKSTPPDHS